MLNALKRLYCHPSSALAEFRPHIWLLERRSPPLEDLALLANCREPLPRGSSNGLLLDGCYGVLASSSMKMTDRHGDQGAEREGHNSQ